MEQAWKTLFTPFPIKICKACNLNCWVYILAFIWLWSKGQLYSVSEWSVPFLFQQNCVPVRKARFIKRWFTERNLTDLHQDQSWNPWRSIGAMNVSQTPSPNITVWPYWCYSVWMGTNTCICVPKPSQQNRSCHSSKEKTTLLLMHMGLKWNVHISLFIGNLLLFI